MALASEPWLADSQNKQQFERSQAARSILSNRCFACHGPDEAQVQADLRLDQRERALQEVASGGRAIVPGDASASQLIQRVDSRDPDFRMPPESHGQPLSESEIRTLREWINDGAPFSRHWSFVKPARPAVPLLEATSQISDTPDSLPEYLAEHGELVEHWSQHPIDAFVWQKMRQQGLLPEPQATPTELIRRVHLDLIGLPPSLEDVQAFVAHPTTQAYLQIVDRLLASPRFGEHWARKWLDLARYADSAGYADDPPRTIWGYRDWVIRAVNRDLPFDTFTRWQLAGDLIPDGGEEALIATAFHRNTMTNNEGGTNDEEFRNVAVVDRVNTTMAVWMGLTMACAQCHNHKYDPISQTEYFQVFAILNQTQDADKRDESPWVAWFTDEQKQNQRQLKEQLESLRKKFDAPSIELQEMLAAWEVQMRQPTEFRSASPATAASQSGFTAKPTEWSASGSDGHQDVIHVPTQAPRDSILVEWELPESVRPEDISAFEIESVPNTANRGQGAGNGPNGNFVLSRVQASAIPSQTVPLSGRWVRIQLEGSDKILSLAEVEVWSNGKNVAVQGKAAQSSDYADAVASRANDGKTAGDYDKGSVSHTHSSNDPWWELDLGSVQTVDAIHIHNRTDHALHTRLSGARVMLLDQTKEQVLWQGTIEQGQPQVHRFEISGAHSLVLKSAVADHAQEGFPAAAVLDKDDQSGWTVGGDAAKSHRLTLITADPSAKAESCSNSPSPPSRPWKVRLELDSKSNHAHHVLCSFRIRYSVDPGARIRASLPASIAQILKIEPRERTPDQIRAFTESFVRDFAAEDFPLRKELREKQARLEAIQPTTTIPVLREMVADKRRETRVQLRGNYKVLGDLVQPGFPSAFPSLPMDPRPREAKELNRRDLADWLMHEDNPLTSRVIANRFWENLFGLGLVRSSEEFGAQGDRPSHPELLDWLATELVRQQWGTKQFLRTLVTSAAYRQSSSVSRPKWEADSENVYLARGPRVRLSAEEVRDQALAVSGLLCNHMYGEPVKPRQPKLGLTAAFGSGTDWETSPGENSVRRGLYTSWRRSNPYPSMATFDAPNREVCILKRDRTNTPLQALVTLNDPVFVEAAQGLARRVVLHQFRQAPQARRETLEQRIALAFQWATAREPTQGEMEKLAELFRQAHLHLESVDAALVQKLATEPIGPLPPGADATELAAWTALANVILNLDEVLFKR
jgi:hypothetical protein